MLWSNLFKNRETVTPECGEQLFEELEARVLLASTAFPPIGSMEDPTNTVVRIETNLGDIDIELFDQAGPGGGSNAPITTANFLNYVRDGDLDESFFHRLVSGFILQGGGFKFDDAGGMRAVPKDAPIVNEFNVDRSNLEGTLAMAKISGDPDSATSQFFFNLVDNIGTPPNGLNFQNGGFTVFAHVIQGWSVVTTIAGLSTVDFSGDADPLAGVLSDLPVTGSYTTGDSLAEDILVEIVDIEIIKPSDTTGFFEFKAYYPDGYRGPDKVETLELVNPNPEDGTQYQIIVRYEIGERDTVIATGALKAHETRTIVLSDFNDPDNNTVRAFDPYAIEIQTSTLSSPGQAIAASINRTDFGATVGESFFNADLFTDAQMHAWTFSGANKTADEVFPFLTWQNLSDRDTTINIAVFTGAGVQHDISMPLEARRRGGLNLSEFPTIPAGNFSVSIIAGREIVVAMSQYDNLLAKTGDQAYTALGTINAGQSEGALAGALLPTDGSGELTILKSGLSLEFLDGTIHFSDGSSSSFTVTLTTLFTRFNLSGLLAGRGVAAGEYVSLSYNARLGTPLTVHYVTEEDGDAISTPFNTYATNIVHFADVFYDPAVTSTQSTVLSIFNPQAGSDIGDQLVFRIEFRFSDGTEIIVANPTTFDALERLDVDIATSTLDGMDAVRTKVASDAAFTTFGVSLAGNNPLIAQLTSTNSSTRNGHTSIGFYADPDLFFFHFLDDSFFNAGAGA